MRLTKIVTNTTVEGPGKRVAIWFQGCSIKCEGCINPELQDFDKGKEYTALEVAKIVKDSGLNKVTILGGEPLDQPAALMSLVYQLKLRVKDVSILLFTGYERKIAKEKIKLIWPAIDVIVAGPYMKDKPDTRKWIGSTNQEIIFNRRINYTWPRLKGFELEFSYDDEGAYINGL